MVINIDNYKGQLFPQLVYIKGRGMVLLHDHHCRPISCLHTQRYTGHGQVINFVSKFLPKKGVSWVKHDKGKRIRGSAIYIYTSTSEEKVKP